MYQAHVRTSSEHKLHDLPDDGGLDLSVFRHQCNRYVIGMVLSGSVTGRTNSEIFVSFSF